MTYATLDRILSVSETEVLLNLEREGLKKVFPQGIRIPIEELNWNQLTRIAWVIAANRNCENVPFTVPVAYASEIIVTRCVQDQLTIQKQLEFNPPEKN